MEGDGFHQELESVCGRILSFMGTSEKTAWELKMELKVSHTVLHLALGILTERGQLTLRPDKLTHVVTPAKSAPTAQADPSRPGDVGPLPDAEAAHTG